jgi:phage-related protein
MTINITNVDLITFALFSFLFQHQIHVLSVLGVTSSSLKNLLYEVGKAFIKTFYVLPTEFFPNLLYFFPQLVKVFWAVFKFIQTLFYDCPEVFMGLRSGELAGHSKTVSCCSVK